MIDPASGLDAKGGLLVENGKIADVGPRLFNDAEAGRLNEVLRTLGLEEMEARFYTQEPAAAG